METTTIPAKSARILEIWDTPGHFSVIAIRKTGGKFEVARGTCQFNGRDGVLSGWSWKRRFALCDTLEEAERCVEENFPQRWSAMQDLEEIRERRRGQ